MHPINVFYSSTPFFKNSITDRLAQSTHEHALPHTHTNPDMHTNLHFLAPPLKLSLTLFFAFGNLDGKIEEAPERAQTERKERERMGALHHAVSKEQL